MSRSSTFSFDTLQLGGFRPLGLACCLLILAVLEFGVARQDWIWRVFPSSDSGALAALEEEVIARTEHPEIVILGSSRIRDAVSPRLLESSLGLKTGSVLNLGITAGRPFDSMTIYRRNRSRLGRADLLIVGIEDWNLLDLRGVSDRIRQFASLGQRLRWFRGTDRLSLVAGWAWKTYDARFVLRNMLRTRRFRRTSEVPIGPDGRIVWRNDDAEVGPEVVDVESRARRLYEDHPFWEERARHFVGELIHMAQEDGVEVVLLRPPLRDSFVAVRETLRPQVAAELSGLFDWAQREHGVAALPFDRASDLGLQPTDFLDYGHLSGRGARIFTRELANQLSQRWASGTRCAVGGSGR